MENNCLSGIERELVLQYLIDGNVPVTVTPIDNFLAAKENYPTQDEHQNDEKLKPSLSTVFPVAIKAEQIKISNQKVIILNPPRSFGNFSSDKVRVEFYFNRLGLFFETSIKENVDGGIALQIPEKIYRIVEIPRDKKNNFNVTLFYGIENALSDAATKVDCFPLENYRLFSKPIWADVPENVQHKAKDYLERLVIHAKKTGTAGNGLQLIPVCRFLAESKERVVSVLGRVNPLEIIFADYERIVFASDISSMKLSLGQNYNLEMIFPLDSPVIKSRKMNLNILVEAFYENDEKTFVAASCKFVEIKEEDKRFLYEKTTNKKFE